MPLGDVDLRRRHFSIGLSTDLVDFIVYSYNENNFDEEKFHSVHVLIDYLETRTETKKFYWIEVINRSSVGLPDNIRTFCKYLDIHSLTIEDITTVTPNIKLDLFPDQASVYLLMKIISWNGQRVEQQQISFYLRYSQNMIVTFQEKVTGVDKLFDEIRNRLRRQRTNTEEPSSPYHVQHRLREMNVDHLFYCLLDIIIDRYMLVFEEIAAHIDHFDEKLMADKRSLALSTFHSIYHIKHDLLHLRILLNPLKEIITRLQRTIDDDQFLFFPRADPSRRLDLKHHLVRRQLRRSPQLSNSQVHTTMNMNKRSSKKSRRKSLFFDKQIYIYFNNLSDHVNQLIDSLEIHRESVAFLLSFWLTLNNNETQSILKLLMLITVLFMPGVFLTGICSMNFNVEPPYTYEYSYYIALVLLGAIFFGMIVWYKVKQWI